MAEDLAQRTWASVWQAIDSGRYDPARAAITTFVYAVAQNHWRQWSRGTVESRTTVTDAPDPIAGEDPAELVAEAELIDAVRRCVRGAAPESGLTEMDREVLNLIAGGSGLTDRALAEQLAVSPSTAHARKRSALDGLRRYLHRIAGEGRPERTGHQGQ